ncbi:hypothetical protein BK659_16570 [Pseudomonas brassicacearum]|uniref:DUF2235 domain-containing protein n=1 Tax=Pseudomonas brassicacearum TaxID=930166 RepID=A0A423H5G8_9PSED|nr:hypothetical protein BK659_16570 [Pseudomonas brassicacearum]
MAGLTGCSTAQFFSGSTQIPIAPTDTGLIDKAQRDMVAPNIQPEAGDSPPSKIISFAFDGTLNDLNRVPSDERPTIVAYIAGKTSGPRHYYRGVGMQAKDVDNLDAALGLSMEKIAEEAKGDLFSKTDEIIQTTPEVELRVFVTGFSRGAASARHFMNIVDEEWAHRYPGVDGHQPPKLRFYTLLYDTVSTNIGRRMKLGLPKSVNYSLHFVAMDEPRGLFPVDVDAVTALDNTADYYVSRIKTIYLPGAHSDIGMSYLGGVGDSYRMMNDILLAQLGFTSDRCFENSNNPMLDGKHDSRGLLDKLLQISGAGTVPKIVRKTRSVTSAELEPSEYRDIRDSNNRLAERNNNQWWVTSTTEYPTFGFKARKLGDENLKLMSVSDTLRSSVSFLEKNNKGETVFKFEYVAGGKNTLILPKQVAKKIKRNETSVDVTYMNIKTGRRYNFFVDNVWVDSIDFPLTKITKVNEFVGCSSFR